MGDENTQLSAQEARHLLRRACFGALPSKVEDFTGLTRGEAADLLLNFPTKRPFKPRGRYIEYVHNSWVKRMISTKHQLQEKLVLFWHDHFACDNNKVADKDRMALQNRLLRQNCKGDFRVFVKAINKDGAMMEYLDTVRNYAEQPNENYARELQELFTLGLKDLNGTTNYDQADIVQIARAFTGWDWHSREKTHFHDYDHDYTIDWPDRGAKAIYKTRGGFGASGADFTQPDGEGEPEIDQVVDIIFQHVDSDEENTVARHIAKKLLAYFAHANPPKAIVDAVIATSSFDTTFDVGSLVRAILCHDILFETMAAPGAGTLKSVKWPIDYVVSTMRLLKIRLKGVDAYVNGGSYEAIRGQLTNMGQTLLEPPSVFGWDWETSWLSSATLLARFGFARDVTAARGGGAANFHPQKLMSMNLTDPGDIVDAVTDLLGITDQLTAGDRAAFVTYLGGPLNLHEVEVRNEKLHGLFCVILQSPIYQVH